MTQLSNLDFKAQTALLYPTNGVGAISAIDLRAQMDNIADSVSFKLTGQIMAPTANDDDVDSGGNGVFEIGDLWIDETNDIIYICVDNSTTAAIWLQIAPANGSEIVSAIDTTLGGSEWQGLPAIISVATSRNLLLTDARDILEIDTSGGAVTVTIPTNASVAFPIGTKIDFTLVDITAAAVIAADAGVVLNGVSAGSGTITSALWNTVTIYKRNTDEWVVYGDIGVVA